MMFTEISNLDSVEEGKVGQVKLENPKKTTLVLVSTDNIKKFLSWREQLSVITPLVT